MRRSRKIGIVAVVIVALLFFFLASVFYWFSQHGPIPNKTQDIVAYRSLGCVFFGVGDSYYTAGGGLPAMFEFSCQRFVFH